MNLLQRIKAVFDSSKVQAASSRSMFAGGEAMRAPFDMRAGVKAYSSWIYAAANLNAISVASTPLRLYVRKRSGRTKIWRTAPVSRATKAYLSGRARQTPSRGVITKAASIGEDFEEVTDSHPILELLARANPYQNGFDSTVLRVLYGELTGNAFIHPIIDKRLRVPVELWTLPSQFVEIIPGKKEFIDGYMYGTDRANRKRFEVDEIIHFKRPNPDSLYWGKGKVEAAWFAQEMNHAVHMMDLKFFQNNARPDSLVTIKDGASESEIRAFEAALQSKLEGARNAGRFVVATADVDIKPLSFPPKDLGGRDDIIEEIAAVFGVPVSMLKANDPNLASARAGFASWRETTILPLLRMDEEQLNQSLVPLFDLNGDAVLAYDNPVLEDEAVALQSRQAAVSGGWLTANEARVEEGRVTMDDPAADQLMVGGRPLGFIPPTPSPFPDISAKSATAETSKNCGIGPDGFQGGNSCGSAEGAGANAPSDVKPVRRRGKSSCRCGCAAGARLSQKSLWNKASARDAAAEFLAITEDEAALGTAVDRVLRKQVADVLREIEAAAASSPELVGKVSTLLSSTKWKREIAVALRPFLTNAIRTGFGIGMETVRRMAVDIPDFAPPTPELDAYAASESVRLARDAADNVNKYTVVRVADIIRNGVAEGKTIPEIAGTVQEWAGEVGDAERGTYMRAVRIARTEATRASRTAELEAWKTSGLVDGKTWLLAPDPCEFCEAAAAQFASNPVGVSDEFFPHGSTIEGADGGVMLLDYEAIQGPPLHPNCRCSLQPRLVARYADLAAELEADIANM